MYLSRLGPMNLYSCIYIYIYTSVYIIHINGWVMYVSKCKSDLSYVLSFGSPSTSRVCCWLRSLHQGLSSNNFCCSYRCFVLCSNDKIMKAALRVPAFDMGVGHSIFSVDSCMACSTSAGSGGYLSAGRLRRNASLCTCKEFAHATPSSLIQESC